MYKRLSHILLVLLLPLVVAIGQEYKVSVEHLSVEQGLSSRFVKDVFQDKDGFIWMATKNGVNRWDGHSFKFYKEKELYQKIYEVQNGDLLFQKNERNESRVENQLEYYSKQDQQVYDLHSKIKLLPEDQSGVADMGMMNDRIWLHTWAHKYYTFTDKVLDRVSFEKQISEDQKIIGGDARYIWFYNNTHIECYDFLGRLVERSKLSGPIRCYDLDGKGGLTILVMEKSGAKGNFQLYKKDLGKPFYKLSEIDESQYYFDVTYGHLNPLRIKKDKKNLNWFWFGENLIAQDEKGAIVFDYASVSKPLGGHDINDVLFDKNDNLWVATEAGIFFIKIQKIPFDYYLVEDKPVHSTRGMSITDKELLVFSYTGVHRIDLENKSAQRVKFDSIPMQVGMGVYNDADTALYVGMDANNLLFVYRPKKEAYELLSTPNNENDSYIGFFLPYRDRVSSTLWIGSDQELYELDGTTNDIRKVVFTSEEKQPMMVRHFYENEKGLWLAAKNGLFLIDPTRRVILEHIGGEQEAFENLKFIHEDKEGVFWLATAGNGLTRWNPENGYIQQFDRKHGFLNLVLSGVYEDKYNRLWISTEKGLALFDKETESARVFLPEHGLPHDEFNTFSHLKAQDGTLYFGGLNGVVSFHPDSILTDNNSNLPVQITSVELNTANQKEATNLTSQYRAGQQIEYSPNDKSLSVKFALLDFSSTNKSYAYKLDGLDQEWTYINDNELSFSGLPYGEYDLIIKGKVEGGTWSKKMASIPLLVAKPFYKSGFFYLICALAIIVIGYSLAVYRVLQLRVQAQKLEQEVMIRTKTIEEQKQALENLNQSKDRLFAIIAHDLKGPVESLKNLSQKVNFLIRKNRIGDVKKLGNTVEDATTGVSQLLDNLLSWALFQEGEFPHDPQWVRIEKLVKDVVKIYRPKANTKQIGLKWDLEEDFLIELDANAFSAILRNLVNNSLKFSESGSEVMIKVWKQDNRLKLSVKDTGIGISKEQLENLFKLEGKRSRVGTGGEKGTGIGLILCDELVTRHGGTINVESEVGVGTTVTVSLPFDANLTKLKKVGP